MPAPKILPWLARQAGIPLERAHVIWRDVVKDASDIYPNQREHVARYAHMALELRRRIGSAGCHGATRPAVDFSLPAQALSAFEWQCGVFRHLCLSWARAVKAAARVWSLPGCKRLV